MRFMVGDLELKRGEAMVLLFWEGVVLYAVHRCRV